MKRGEAVSGNSDQDVAKDQARQAVLHALAQAESLIGEVMSSVVDRRSKESLSEAIQKYIDAYGEPRFRIRCPACGTFVVDLPLAYPSARGLWTWMPPTYYVAVFNRDSSKRRCQRCDAYFPPVNPQTD